MKKINTRPNSDVVYAQLSSISQLNLREIGIDICGNTTKKVFLMTNYKTFQLI